MKTKKPALLFAALLLGGMSASYALEMTGLKPGVPASTATAQAMAKRHATLYGGPAGQSQASRIIDVKPGIRYVNVDSGETVAFRAGEKIVDKARPCRLQRIVILDGKHHGGLLAAQRHDLRPLRAGFLHHLGELVLRILQWPVHGHLLARLSS